MFKPLRDKILELAISGKLVPQLDSEPAVEQIGPAPAKDEVPFELPEKWKWVLIRSIAKVVRGGSPRPISEYLTDANDPLGLNWVRIGDATCGGKIITSCKERIKADGLSKTRLISKGSLILSNSMSYGRPYILGVEGCIHDGWLALSDFEQLVEVEFFYYVLLSSYSQQQFALKAQGTTVSNLNADRVRSLFIPLPPLEEQRRIVAKLDDIMGNLERMDQAYTELSGPMAKHFKNLVLQQAISGQLVPQLDSEPVVEQIGPAPTKEEEPFALPKKWKWVRLGLLGSWKSGQTPKRTEQSYWVRGSINWLKTGELNDGVITFSEEKISQKAVEDLNIRVNPVDSVLIAMYGATAGKLGILSKPCATNQACCACIVDTKLLANWFLFYVLLAFRAELIGMAAGSAQSNLSKEKIESFWFPLPPIEEQRRIVARIEELFGDVDKLLEWQQFA